MKWEKFLSRKFIAMVAVLVVAVVMLILKQPVDEVKKILDALWPYLAAYVAGNAASALADAKGRTAGGKETDE